MKKIFVFVVMALLLTSFSYAQKMTVVKDLGTMTNSVDETGYLDLSQWSQVDSVSIAFVAKGETDVDSLTFYGAVNVGGQFVKSPTVLANQTVTVNVAAGVYVIENLLTSGATPLTGVALRGLNALYYVTRGATSGNDPTDPNHGWIVFQIWGTK